MDFKEIFFYFSCVFAIIILLFTVFSKNKLKILFFNAISGILILALINLTSDITGVYLPINEYTVTYCTVFGTFGSVLFLLLNLIFL